jgi:hypothetical protein
MNADKRRFVDETFKNRYVTKFSMISASLHHLRSIISSPQRTQRTQSEAVTLRYEKATAWRNGTRMTRIGRIFTDTKSVRIRIIRAIRVLPQLPWDSASLYEKSGYFINNELVRTDTNSNHSEFVRVRISSLLMYILLHFFIIIYELRFIANSVVKFLHRTYHCIPVTEA